MAIAYNLTEAIHKRPWITIAFGPACISEFAGFVAVNKYDKFLRHKSGCLGT